MSNWKQGYIPSNEPHRQATRQAHRPAQKTKRNIQLLISCIFGVVFLVILAAGTFSRADQTLSQTAKTMEDVGFQVGTMIGAALMIPQMVLTGIAIILNAVGWGSSSRGFSLAGAIVYSVSTLLMIVNAPFLLPSIVLSFVGYAKLKK